MEKVNESKPAKKLLVRCKLVMNLFLKKEMDWGVIKEEGFMLWSNLQTEAALFANGYTQ